jgi:hypothetical protein
MRCGRRGRRGAAEGVRRALRPGRRARPGRRGRGRVDKRRRRLLRIAGQPGCACYWWGCRGIPCLSQRTAAQRREVLLAALGRLRAWLRRRSRGGCAAVARRAGALRSCGVLCGWLVRPVWGGARDTSCRRASLERRGRRRRVLAWRSLVRTLGARLQASVARRAATRPLAFALQRRCRRRAPRCARRLLTKPRPLGGRADAQGCSGAGARWPRGARARRRRPCRDCAISQVPAAC